ncbi:MAG: hypothetical protein NEA02_01115 [Thermoanaerobaculia bacterium]|nr:hypothetical protein [Thermoanaerobaculia bacterium]
MAEKTEKSWWERNVEDNVAADYDRQRAQISEYDTLGRLEHDIKVGALKGAYGFGKGLLVGIVDIAKVGYKLYTNDPETAEKTWQLTKKVAKESWIAVGGTPEQKADQNKRCTEALLTIGKAVYHGMKADWEAASGTEGKRTELISKWAARGVLEVAALFIGAGEIQEAANAAKAAKLLEEGAVLEKYLAECEAVRALEEMQALEAVRAAEAARAAKAAEEAAALAKAKAAEEAAAAAKAKQAAKEAEAARAEAVTKKIKVAETDAAPSKAAARSASGWKPPEKLSGGKYADKQAEMTGLGKDVDERYPVKIFTESELESRRVVARDGKLVFAETGEPVTTTKDTIYVMDRHGNMFIDESEFGSVHHSSLAGGEEPVAAGHIGAKDGRVTMLNESSGHYGENLKDGASGLAKDELARQGVDTSATVASGYK